MDTARRWILVVGFFETAWLIATLWPHPQWRVWLVLPGLMWGMVRLGQRD